MRWLVVVMVFAFGLDARADTARISWRDARRIALARVPGTIVHEKLKTEKHHAPIYSIKIQPAVTRGAGVLTKVEVDGDTARVIKVKEVDGKERKKKKAKKTDDDD